MGGENFGGPLEYNLVSPQRVTEGGKKPIRGQSNRVSRVIIFSGDERGPAGRPGTSWGLTNGKRGHEKNSFTEVVQSFYLSFYRKESVKKKQPPQYLGEKNRTKGKLVRKNRQCRRTERDREGRSDKRKKQPQYRAEFRKKRREY